jgi:hypothetical protein
MRTPPTQSSSSTGIARGADRESRSASTGSFRDALKRRESTRKPAPSAKSRPVRNAGLHTRPDGMLVVSGPIGAPMNHPDSRRPSANPRAMTAASLGARRSDARSIAITDVKVGGTKDGARVHARLGEGRHAGIELRAHEQNGKISIELVARDADAARALRGELADLRESLRARGLDAVNVEVRADVRDDGGQHESTSQGGEYESDATGDLPASAATVPSAAGETDDIVL